VCLCVCPSVSVYVRSPEDGIVGMKAGETRELRVYACTCVSLCVCVYVRVCVCM